MGGWLPDFKVMWRVMRNSLLVFGFPMKHIDAVGKPINFTNEDLHTNLLSSLQLSSTSGSPSSSLLVACTLLPDVSSLCPLMTPASAISWMHVAGECNNPGVRRLAHLASALLVQACSLIAALFQTHHIPSKQNNEAECLSHLFKKLIPFCGKVMFLLSHQTSPLASIAPWVRHSIPCFKTVPFGITCVWRATLHTLIPITDAAGSMSWASLPI